MKIKQAKAISRSIRVSPRKLALVANLIRHKRVDDAMIQLEFSKKRIAQDVKKCLKSAIFNAENNHFMNIDELYITDVKVGKSILMKRFHARARGRGAGIHKFFSNLTITVTELPQLGEM